MANLPEQVQRQVDAAEAILATMQPAEATTQPTAQENVEQPANVTSVQQVTTPIDENSETYAQRWRSLQGVYNATVRRERDLTARVQQLETMLSALHQQPAQQTQTQQGATLLSESDVKEYGDSIDVMRKVAREELAPIISQLQGSMQTLNNNVSTQVQQVAHRQMLTAEQMFYQNLAAVVPNWENINAQAGFQSWLGETDPLTGIQRQIYLDNAHKSLDVNRVASFFHQWSKAQQPAAPAPQVSPQTVSTRNPASELERQIAPSRTRVMDQPTGSTNGKIYSRVDISKFYEDVRKGHYRGKEAERDAIERDIVAATRENRVLAS